MYIIKKVGNEGGDCIKQVSLVCDGNTIEREGSAGGDPHNAGKTCLLLLLSIITK
jgi:hypothetical protein